MPVNLILCSNFYPPFFVGGAEVIAHEQARYLQKLGCRVTVFCGRHDEAKPRYSLERDRHDGIAVIRVILHAEDYQLGQNFYKPSVDARFNTLLEEVQPDVVHFHNLVGLSLGLIQCASQRQIRTVMTFHDHWGFCSKNTLLKSGEQVCQDFSRCSECQPELWETPQHRTHIRMRNDYLARSLAQVDCFVSPSEYLASAYTKAGIPQDRLRVISYGIDFERFSAIKKEIAGAKRTVQFTFVGHLGFHKGVHVVMDALQRLHQQRHLGSTLQMNIVGVGEMEAELKQFVQAEGLEACVHLWGRIDHRQIDQVYEKTDVLVTSSIWPENEPVTILEAMSTGIPVLASNLGGNLNLVEPGKTGELAEVGSGQSLAEKMLELAQNPDTIRRMGEQAQARMSQDTFSTYAEKILQVYQDSQPAAAPLGDRPIVLCTQGLSVSASQALSHFDSHALYPSEDFLSFSWIEDQDWDQVILFWVTGEAYSKHHIQSILKQGIPLLVPANHPTLVALCRDASCGLFYEDEFEALVCLEHLLTQKQLRETMGQNARTYAEQNRIFRWPWQNSAKIVPAALESHPR